MVTTVYDTEFTYELTELFGGPYYTGTSASSPEVPSKYDVALDGRGFMLDSAPLWRTIATLRTQNDDREAGELSLNPEGLWRRSNSSWELGAGQEMYDDENAQRQRFRASKGVDVWTPGKATLLPDTTLQAAVSSGAEVVQIVSTAEHVYWANDQTVVRSDLTTETDVVGTPAADVTSMISVGSYVLVGYAGNGVYAIEAGSTSAAPWVTDAVSPSVVGWAKGRVIVGVGRSIYNPVTSFTSSGALATPMLQHPDAAFEWRGVAEGTSWIFMGGVSGDKSTIYRTVIRADGTELDVPTVAGRLPDGEVLTTMYGYLGVLILGTTRGFRIAQANGNGDLVIGALIEFAGHTPTGHEGHVHTMFGRGQFVYFGWTNLDTISTGIGRMDLSNLTDVDNLVPAYASDLMATTQGDITGIGYHKPTDTMVFGVNGVGVYKQSHTDLVASGTITSGIIRWGLTEEKVVVGARAGVTGPGTVTLELATDGGTFASIGPSGAQERGVNYELRATIRQSGTDVSPVFESMTLYCYPAPQGTMFIDIPVQIFENVQTREGIEVWLDLAARLEFLRDRFLSKVLVAAQIGSATYQVTLEAFRFEAAQPAENQPGAWQGIATLSLKVLT